MPLGLVVRATSSLLPEGPITRRHSSSVLATSLSAFVAGTFLGHQSLPISRFHFYHPKNAMRLLGFLSSLKSGLGFCWALLPLSQEIFLLCLGSCHVSLFFMNLAKFF